MPTAQIDGLATSPKQTILLCEGNFLKKDYIGYNEIVGQITFFDLAITHVHVNS